MKIEDRQLRVSGYKDYVAVDIINAKGIIISTPFYLRYKGMQKVKYKDDEGSLITTVFMSEDSTHLLCKGSDGFEFTAPFDELLESHIQFI